MAGYSGTPLLKKLGIGDASRVRILNAPATLPEELQPFASAKVSRELDIVVLFADSVVQYKAGFARWMHAIHPDGAIWIAWPKKSSGVQTDLTENIVRDLALTTPFVDVKICAIDETWSGLKLVVRRELRATFATSQGALGRRP